MSRDVMSADRDRMSVDFAIVGGLHAIGVGSVVRLLQGVLR